MIRRQVTLCNKLGLHARAASKLVQTATGFDCSIWLERDHRRVNAKSIMGVLMLAAPCGTTLEVECDGPDEKPAMDAIEELIEQRFGED
ncbi:MAG: HPr family phosphocarrier protein [Wenzhouxiangellaceae bacterium]